MNLISNKKIPILFEETEPLISTRKLKKKRNFVLIALLGSILIGSIIGFGYRFNEDRIQVNKVNKALYEDDPWIEEPTELIKGKNGGVASEQGDCSKIGVQILKKGGSAVDSAIATAICIGAINGFSSGIGGGGFSIIRTPSGKVEHIDFRESAPSASNKTMYDKRPEKVQVGGLAVGVPGEIRGFELMHQKYGKLPWKDLFEPSIKLCELGFEAGIELVRQLNLGKKWILENEEFKKVYSKNGELVNVGDLVYRPELASTLKRISVEGSSAFYEGKIANEIVQFTQQNGGIITLEDLKNYKPIIRDVAIGKFFNSTIISTTAPSAGSILISTLKLLEEVIKTNGKGGDVDIYHKFIECLKFGFAMRTRIGDPDFNKNITSFSEKILTKEYIENLAVEVDLKSTHNFDYYHPQYDTKELPGTTHISVIDNSGLVVSLTSTINLEFGSRLMTPNSGIILNDEMDDFSLPNVTNGFNLAPSPLNWIQPHKRPLSSTVPTIVIKPNGDIISLGGSGGSRILSAVAQILLEIEVNGKDLIEAIDTPRIHHQLIPETIFLEKAFDKNIINGLFNRGHNVTKWPRHKSVVQIVKRKKNGNIEALSDGRKHGLAFVY